MSTKEEILEHLIMPIAAIFGDMTDGSINFLLENTQKYSVDDLKMAAESVISTCEKYPYPATILKAFHYGGYVPMHPGAGG